VPLRHVKSAHNKWEKDVTRTVLATPAPPGAE